jgi:hypothetical protein
MSTPKHRHERRKIVMRRRHQASRHPRRGSFDFSRTRLLNLILRPHPQTPSLRSNLGHEEGGLASHHRCEATSPDVAASTSRLLGTKMRRPDGPRSGQSAPMGRTVCADAEQIRVPSFLLCLLARISG